MVTVEMMRNVLLHEMCHAAVQHITKIPAEHPGNVDTHGPVFKFWADFVEHQFKRMHLDVTIDYVFDPKKYVVEEATTQREQHRELSEGVVEMRGNRP